MKSQKHEQAREETRLWLLVDDVSNPTARDVPHGTFLAAACQEVSNDDTCPKRPQDACLSNESNQRVHGLFSSNRRVSHSLDF